MYLKNKHVILYKKNQRAYSFLSTIFLTKDSFKYYTINEHQLNQQRLIKKIKMLQIKLINHSVAHTFFFLS